GAVTCNVVLTGSDGHLRAQRPWAGLRTRWPWEEAVAGGAQRCHVRRGNDDGNTMRVKED
ncbi:hypothetical protein B296_00048854, partial [Ensete ventricosum]